MIIHLGCNNFKNFNEFTKYFIKYFENILDFFLKNY